MCYLLKIDFIIRRWLVLAVFLVFTGAVSRVWVSSLHAQTPIENSMRLAEMESWKREQVDVNRATALVLADHDRKQAVFDVTLREHSKQLEEISGYEKWLVLGVFALLGTKAWEKLVAPKAEAPKA